MIPKKNWFGLSKIIDGDLIKFKFEVSNCSIKYEAKDIHSLFMKIGSSPTNKNQEKEIFVIMINLHQRGDMDEFTLWQNELQYRYSLYQLKELINLVIKKMKNQNQNANRPCKWKIEFFKDLDSLYHN